MKSFAVFVVLASLALPGMAQGRIFKCGNTYTNDEAQSNEGKCKEVKGGDVTVTKGTPAKAPFHVLKPRTELQKFRDGLGRGDQTSSGMVVEVKSPIAQVQTTSGLQWVRIDTLMPPAKAGAVR